MLTALLSVGFASAAVARADTTLTVDLKGVTPNNAESWLTLSLSGRFDVAVGGTVIGQVTANPTAEQAAAGESDTLTLPDSLEGGVTLQPTGDIAEGYVCQGPIPVEATAGAANRQTVFAYAERGLFRVENTLADGAAAGAAEFMVLDSQGTMQWSFTTDANGTYTAERALPNGAYQLVQMRAPQGSLLLDKPVDFTVDTYFGNADSIAAIQVANPAVPVQNGQTGELALSATTLQGSTEEAYATLTVSGFCAGENTLALDGYTVTLNPATLLDSDGNPVAAEQAVRVDTLTVRRDGGACSVQPLDAAGQPAGEAVPCAAGETVTLDNAAGVAVKYLDGQGQESVPAGFVAGTLEARLRYAPAAALPTQRTAVAAKLTAGVAYTYQYPDVDGISQVTASADIAPAEATLTIPDGRLALSPAVGTQPLADGTPALTLAKAEQTLPETPLSVAVELPTGTRVLESALEQGLTLLRTAQSDLVVLDTARWATGPVTIPLATGSVTAVTVWVYDPCDRPRTVDEPQGYTLSAQAHGAQPLLDALLGHTQGYYAQWDAVLPATIETGKTAPALSPLLSGTVAEKADMPVTAVNSLGVLLTGATGGIVYGDVTDAVGAFAIEGDGALTAGTVSASLPANTVAATSGKPGVYREENVTLPREGYAIDVLRTGSLSGTAATAAGQPAPGMELSLSQMGQVVQTATTDASGNYAITGLTAGQYALRIALPTGSSATLTADEPLTPNANGVYTLQNITLAYGEQRTLNLTATLLSVARGAVLEGDAPLAGLAVTLTGADGAPRDAVTDEQGEYAFAGLADGAYTLNITLPEHTAVIAVNGQANEAAQTKGAYAAQFTLSAGETRNERLTVGQTASITGRINALGAGQTIAIASTDVQRTATTGEDGSFALAGLAGGDYTVYAPLPAGKTLIDGSQWRVTEKGDMIWLTVTVAAGSDYTLPEVDYVAMTSLAGVAYMDENTDLRYQDGEQLMSGVPVTLQHKDGDAWTDEASTATDEYGRYAFQSLTPGVYRVAAGGGDGVSVSAVGPEATVPQGDAAGAKISADITLANGDQASGQSDIALGRPAGLKAAVFYDSNEDGVRGVYERTVAGVTVEAVPASNPEGDAAATAVTDANGEAAFDSLAPGTYVLRFTLQKGYLFTVNTGKWSVGYSCVGGSDASSALSAPLTLEAGQTAEAGAGVIPVGSFGGTVWSDLNNNGIQDAGEPGVAGVNLTLEGTRTGKTYALTTDETGAYNFLLLRDDAYNFTAEIPADMLFARYSQTGGDARSVFTTEGTKATRQFIVSGAESVISKNVGVVQKAALSGIAFLDSNFNGVYDQGEPAYPGVTVELVKNSNDRSMGKVVTGEDGVYTFDSLRGGDYRLRAILPNDGCIFTMTSTQTDGLVNLFAAREGRRENTIPSVTLVNGQTTETCVGVAMGGVISGTVFLDAKYNGTRDGSDKRASGVKVQLVDAAGTLVASDTTNANGSYTLEGIMPGSYTVRFQRREGYAFTRYRPKEENGNHVQTLAKDGFGETEAIDVAMGQTIEHINAGMLPSSTLTGTFFDDANDNGLMDEGEGGFTDGAVRLLSEDGELDLTETVGEDGTYFFDGVMPGQYTVTYILPENATLANVAEGGNTLTGKGAQTALEGFAVESGKAYTAPLVGAVTLGTFEGYAYHDQNGNGTRDEGEALLSGVSVALAPDKAGLETAQAVTGEDGHFAIADLRPAAYRLTLTLPDGYIFSGNLTQSGLTLATAGKDTVACPWAALVNRAQNAIGAVKPATIRASVWLDENRDGSQSEDERLYAGLNYELYDEALGKVVKTARSDTDGYVTFTDVRPATYTVRFAIPAEAQPAGDAQSTFTAQGAMMSHSGVTVAEGETFDRISGGLVSYTSIGGVVALDVGGQRTSLEDVSVYLYQGDGAEPVKATRTDEKGEYRFDSLWPDEYRVAIEKPEGMIFVKPDDPAYPAGESVVTETADGIGTSDAFPLEMAQHRLDMDAILIKPARVGDQVWLDQNANGLMDADEPSVNGVTIELVADGQTAYTTTSNEWGYYEFDDVYPGEYTLRAKAYPELTITTPVPALRIISSCLTAGDGDSATSDPFSVESGSTNFDLDLGYVLREGQTMPGAIVPGSVQSWAGTAKTE